MNYLKFLEHYPELKFFGQAFFQKSLSGVLGVKPPTLDVCSAGARVLPLPIPPTFCKKLDQKFLIYLFLEKTETT